MNDDLLITQRLLRADEVAEILNVSRAYAYQLMQRGEIRTVTFGSARRVRPEDLQDVHREIAATLPQSANIWLIQ